MLTGVVNIAIFAAFWHCVTGVLGSNAEFKRVCLLVELDIACYGWQKRQKVAREMAKSGKDGRGCGDIQARMPATATR
jgi:hypothetical protein